MHIHIHACMYVCIYTLYSMKQNTACTQRSGLCAGGCAQRLRAAVVRSVVRKVVRIVVRIMVGSDWGCAQVVVQTDYAQRLCAVTVSNQACTTPKGCARRGAQRFSLAEFTNSCVAQLIEVVQYFCSLYL